jgi:hypothetical protein
MRRLLSLVLLATFGFPLIAPALALGQDVESSLPACCRRNGTHHCTGNMQRPPISAPAVSERCPSFPQPSSAPAKISSAALAPISASITFGFSAAASPQQAEIPHRISPARSHQKRGPPPVSLA